MRTVLWTFLVSLVVAHHVLLWMFAAAFFVLPFREPWHVSIPLMAFICFFSTNRVDCQLTNLENYLRKSLGLRRIGGFVGSYYKKPVMIMLGRKRA